MAEHYKLGKKGEELATAYLLKKGYEIVMLNYHFQKAEVDIIAQKQDILVAVEVKTRSSTYFGNPQDFVSKKKIQLLVKAMNEFVTQRNLDVEVRFDIVSIVKDANTYKIEHFEDAFYHF